MPPIHPQMKSQKRSKRKVYEMEVEFVEKNKDRRSDSGDFQEETGFKKPNLMRDGEKMVGVRTTRSGKFWAEIKDPIKRTWVWLGVFGTAEAASRAYLAQESKFAAAKLRAEQRVESAASQNSPFQDLVVLDSHSPPTSAGKKIEGVVSCKSGKFGASVRDPFKRKRVWLGLFTTAEEASRAHLAKKAELEAKKLRVQKLQFEAKMLRDKRRMDEVASGKSSLQGSAARTRISDVRKTNSGKFSAAITDPITKRRVWIGTFTSEEEASRAYFFKEADFAAEKLRANGRIDPVTSDKSTFQESVSSVRSNDTLDLTSFQGGARTSISNVRRQISGKFSAEITDPITKSRIWLGSFATEEEASRAYLAMDAEFAAEKLRADWRIDPVASDKSTFEDSVSSDLGNSTSCSISFQESARTRISDVRRRNSAKYLSQESMFAAGKLRAKQAASQNSQFQVLMPSVLDSHNPQTSAGMKIEGVQSTKSGKFGASIRDPFKKKVVWLGSFTTAEEASRAYLAKKALIEAKQLSVQKTQLEAKQLRAKRRIDRVASGKSTFQGGATTRISGVYRRNLGRFSAEIRHPITKRRVWIGTFASKPKASRAYRAKEAEFEEELRAKQHFERVATDKSLAPGFVSSVIEIETSDLSNETGVAESVGENKVSGDQEARFGFFNGVQVVDKNGFLVGEFSMLDDLSICSL